MRTATIALLAILAGCAGSPMMQSDQERVMATFNQFDAACSAQFERLSPAWEYCMNVQIDGYQSERGRSLAAAQSMLAAGANYMALGQPQPVQRPWVTQCINTPNGVNCY